MEYLEVWVSSVESIQLLFTLLPNLIIKAFLYGSTVFVNLIEKCMYVINWKSYSVVSL